MANAITLSGKITKWEGSPTTIIPYQRDVDNSTDVAISGIYSGGTPTHIEYQWPSGGFSTISSESIGGGNWSGTLPAKAGNEGTLTVRWSNDTATTDTTVLALGDYFLIIGDSIAVGAHINNLTANATPKHSRWTNTGGGQWVEWDSTSGGPDSGAWPYLCNEITSSQSVPVGFVLGASSGSEIADWRHGLTKFDTAMTDITTFGVNKFRGILIHLGINNAHGSGNTAAAIKALIQATCTDLNTYVPGGATASQIIWAPPGPIDTSSGTRRTEIDAVRQGFLDAYTAGYCTRGPFYNDLTFAGDSLHPENNDAADLAGRWWLAISDVLYGTSNGRGPRATSCTYKADKTEIYVNLDKALGNSLASDVIGFKAFNGGGSAATISTAKVTTTKKITLALSSAATGTPTVTFGSDNDAVGSTAPKETTQTNPSTATAARPLEFFNNQTTTLQSTISRAVGGIFGGVVR